MIPSIGNHSNILIYIFASSNALFTHVGVLFDTYVFVTMENVSTSSDSDCSNYLQTFKNAKEIIKFHLLKVQPKVESGAIDNTECVSSRMSRIRTSFISQPVPEKAVNFCKEESDSDSLSDGFSITKCNDIIASSLARFEKSKKLRKESDSDSSNSSLSLSTNSPSITKCSDIIASSLARFEKSNKRSNKNQSTSLLTSNNVLNSSRDRVYNYSAYLPYKNGKKKETSTKRTLNESDKCYSSDLSQDSSRCNKRKKRQIPKRLCTQKQNIAKEKSSPVEAESSFEEESSLEELFDADSSDSWLSNEKKKRKITSRKRGKKQNVVEPESSQETTDSDSSSDSRQYSKKEKPRIPTKKRGAMKNIVKEESSLEIIDGDLSDISQCKKGKNWGRLERKSGKF